MKQNSPEALCAFDEKEDCLNVIIETPKGSRNKFKWDEKNELYRLSNVLPTGESFPFDFGFVPSTRGDDGDPVDVLLLMDEPVFPGCLVQTRLIGVLECETDGKRNDRLVGIAKACRMHQDVDNINDLPDEVLREFEHFFTSYHRAQGKDFKILDRRGPKHAVKLVKMGEALDDKGSKKKASMR